MNEDENYIFAERLAVGLYTIRLRLDSEPIDMWSLKTHGSVTTRQVAELIAEDYGFKTGRSWAYGLGIKYALKKLP